MFFKEKLKNFEILSNENNKVSFADGEKVYVFYQYNRNISDIVKDTGLSSNAYNKILKLLNIVDKEYFYPLDKICFITNTDEYNFYNKEWTDNAKEFFTSHYLKSRGWLDKSSKNSLKEIAVYINLPAIKKEVYEGEYEDKKSAFNALVTSTIFHELTHAIRENPLFGYSDEAKTEESVIEEEAYWYWSFTSDILGSPDNTFIIFEEEDIEKIS